MDEYVKQFKPLEIKHILKAIDENNIHDFSDALMLSTS
jgi:hypothetical protein